MKLQRLCVLAIFLIASLQVFSQSRKSSVSGKILTPDNLPAESVSVFFKNTQYSAITNEKGEYTIDAEPGKYTLIISYIGFKSKEMKVVVQEENTQIQNVIVEEDVKALNEVQVEGKSSVQRIREQAYNVTAIDAKQLYNTSSDINQVLNKTTGVRIRESGGLGSNFNFTLNGFSGNQVKFFLDGIPIDNYGSSFTLNNIPINMAERIDIYKGVVPIELGGDALGGAVNIITNKNINRYIDASYSFGSFNTHKAAINTRFSNKNGFILNVNAFTNYSDNDYKVDVSIADRETGQYLPERKFRHFHDGYKSGTMMVEGGVKNKKFADYLLIGAIVTGNKKEIQQGSTMQRVVGEAYTESKGFIPSLKYKKDNLFTDGLSLNFTTSYNISQGKSVDVSSKVYDWTGGYTYRTYGNTPDKGELGDKTIYVYDEKTFQTATNLKYQITDNQTVALNHSYTGYNRKENDEYKEIIRPGKPTINKGFLGLSYNVIALDQRLSVSAFGKRYDLSTKMVSNDALLSKSSSFYGYGTAATYHIIPELQVKASYEYAYRMPTATEMLGDGLSIKSNIDLKPEKSSNINAGLAFTKKIEKHTFGLESSYIFRNAKDFIQNVRLETTSKYENQESIRVQGVDGAIRYGYSELLTFEINATYQKTTNTNKFAPPGTQIHNYLYGAQLPNTPIFYGNADLTFMFKNVSYTHDQLSVNVGANYIDAYYLSWPIYGDSKYKKAIPEQFTQNLGATYSFQNGKYNVALDCRNITDVKVYDYFNVQKPGRSFTIKFRYFFNN
ncbi:TonB-dependent receptor [Flavobacterium sp. '19STA2R22 D10 B1']|uniref:TonB-dependent receptor n=1 Tax=Flavobacterium aerium TaxID=3037261 RepID=UPI00278C8216|nr:TonB-dependent receptor [Flavobacterium sp. '19STA2R22 D10 B1']